MIIQAFKSKLFPFYSGNYYEELEEESSDGENEELSESEDKIPDISTSEQITMLDKFYGPDLICKYFKEKSLIEILNQLKDYRKNPRTFQKYNNLMVYLIIVLRKLEKDIRNMPEDEVEKKRLNYLKDLVRKIVDTNQKFDDMPPLETEEEHAQRLQGQGLRTLPPQQMIIRLPILLVQLKAGNNSQKLKNEIRQLLYSFYRSKNLSKTIYNSLMNTI